VSPSIKGTSALSVYQRLHLRQIALQILHHRVYACRYVVSHAARIADKTAVVDTQLADCAVRFGDTAERCLHAQ
jgi:hypothetical protein